MKEINHFDILKHYESVRKTFNKNLRDIFNGQINTSFLIEIKSRVEEQLGNEIQDYYNFNIEQAPLAIMSGEEWFEVDICKHIIGLHHSYSIFETKESIHANEENEIYKDRLVADVISHIRMRGLGSANFRVKKINQEDKFIYYHIPYDLHVVCGRINYLLKKIDKLQSPYLVFYSLMSNKGLEVLHLLEDGLWDGTYPLCRGIIELFVKLFIVKYTNRINEYVEFLHYQNIKIIHHKYDENFDVKFNRTNLDKSKKLDYLNFGWVDSISDYKQVVKKKLWYKINGLFEYFTYITRNSENANTVKNLNRFYQICNGFVHGNVGMSIYPLMHYFDVCSMLYATLLQTYLLFCSDFKQTTLIENKNFSIDIVAKTDKDFELLISQRNKLSEERLKEYNEQNGLPITY